MHILRRECRLDKRMTAIDTRIEYAYRRSFGSRPCNTLGKCINPIVLFAFDVVDEERWGIIGKTQLGNAFACEHHELDGHAVREHRYYNDFRKSHAPFFICDAHVQPATKI